MECKEKMFKFLPGKNSVEVVDDSIVGKWIIALYHAQPTDVSLASNKKTLDKRK